MNKEVTFRQIALMYIFISLSPILRQIPTALAKESGRSGYLSPIWAMVAIVPLTAILIGLMKSFDGLNIFEIMEELMGKFLAKVIIFGYMLWLFALILGKVNIYALTLQFTLMPKTQSGFFLVVLILMVYYALMRGIKTVFRFSEFTLGAILVLFLVLFLSAIPNIRFDYLLPVSSMQLPQTIKASTNVISVGGNIIIALFFADKFGISVGKHRKKLWMGVLIFAVLTFVITLFTFGVTGPALTAQVPFPFYITVKSISFFQIFERFEALITIISVLSDFIAVCIYAIMLLYCMKWLFHLKEVKFLYAPLTVVVYYLTFYVSRTQFEFDYFYRTIIVNSSIIFQYFIPFFLGFLCLLQRKKLKKQF